MLLPPRNLVAGFCCLFLLRVESFARHLVVATTFEPQLKIPRIPAIFSLGTEIGGFRWRMFLERGA